MKITTYINVEFIVYEFVSMEHGTQIFIARIIYVWGPPGLETCDMYVEKL